MNEYESNNGVGRSLLLPTWIPLLVAIAAGLVASYGNSKIWEGFGYVVITFLAGPVMGILCALWFIRVAKRRYAEGNLFLISIGYLLGQIIATIALYAFIVFMFL
jgi:hypothetical protein